MQARLTDCLLLLMLVIASLSPPSRAGQGNYPFALRTEKEADGHRILGENRGPAPVSIRVEIAQKAGTASDQSFPLEAVVPANSETVLAHIGPSLPGHGYSFRTRASWMPGDFQARPDPAASYRLPWPDGEGFRVSQAEGGPITTHNTPGSRYAVDIPMPKGTPILAARAGVVVEAEEAETEGGTSSDMLTRANAVRILHDDGSMSTYAHLAHNGVFVTPGQRVAEGETIALSGDTGYSSGPHLHFAVQATERSATGFEAVSLPFHFRIGNPPVTFEPRHGMLLVADYQQPGRLPSSEHSLLLSLGTANDGNEIPSGWLLLAGLPLIWLLRPGRRKTGRR